MARDFSPAAARRRSSRAAPRRAARESGSHRRTPAYEPDRTGADRTAQNSFLHVASFSGGFFCVNARRNPHDRAEGRVKVAETFETDGQSGFEDVVSRFAEQSSGAMNPVALQIS